MSKAVTTYRTTSIAGYYNGNKWPLQVVISELNVTINLKEGEYIRDVHGRQINDSFFDRYTRPLQLSKEMALHPVALIEVPRIPHAPPPSSQHSVRAVEKFETDSHGVRRPVLTPPPPVVAPPPNQSSIMAMSMADARRIGLVGKVREVSEDYGAPETDGAPLSVDKAPPIRVAIESTPKVRTLGDLPKELTTPEFADKDGVIQKLGPAAALAARTLQQTLSKAANSTNVDSPTGFLNESRVNALPQPTIVAPNGQPASNALPPPNIPGAAAGFAQSQVEGEPPVQSEPVAPKRAAKPKAAKIKVAAPPVEEAQPFLCHIDGKRFKYRSQLKTHARRKYPQQEIEILAQYPEQVRKLAEKTAEQTE